MSNQPLAIDARLYQYIVDVAVKETPPQRALREATRDHPASVMQIAPDQGQFMAFLVRLIAARRIVEIGTFTGYSALCMAQALPADGELVCCDVSEEYTAIGKPYWEQAGVIDKIDLRIAPALTTLDALIADQQRFDLAFIDADKENYPHYFDRCLSLLRSGGLILFDNTLWSGRVADPCCDDPDTLALRELNEALAVDPRVDVALLTIADGLTLARVL